MNHAFQLSVCLRLSDYGGDEAMIREEAELFRRHGVGCVEALAYDGGVAWYRSDLVNRAEGDALGVLAEALGGSDVELNAIFPVFVEEPDSHLYQERGLRPALQRDGRPASEAAWRMRVCLCPNEVATRHVRLEQIREALDRYPAVGAVSLDWVGWGPDTCFCPKCAEEFRSRVGARPDQLSEHDLRRWVWQSWRAAVIEQFVRGARALAATHGRGLKVNVHAQYPECRTMFGQDWKRWCDLGLVDAVQPRVFSSNAEEIQRLMASYLNMGAPTEKLQPHAMGGMAPSPTPGELAALVRAVRDAGAGGVCLFRPRPLKDEDFEAIAAAL